MKNKYIRNAIAYLAIVLLLSCKKENTTPANLATFIVVNVINNGGPVKADFTGKENVFATTGFEIEYPRSNRFAVPALRSVPVKVVSSYNTDDILYDKSFEFQTGEVYALFLLGEPGKVDTLLIKEDIEPIVDSTMAIQFVNCSPTGAVKIVPVLNNSDGTTVPLSPIFLDYKGHTIFMPFEARYSLSWYTFEFRDPTTDDLLGSSSMEWNIQHTTIVVAGYANGDPSISGARVNYERF